MWREVGGAYGGDDGCEAVVCRTVEVHDGKVQEG